MQICTDKNIISSPEPITIPAEIVARFPQGVLPVSRWTHLSLDDKYMTHLLNLFFVWDNTLSHIVHRSVFTDELTNGTEEGQRFCSEFLVHTILAIAHVSNKQSPLPTFVSYSWLLSFMHAKDHRRRFLASYTCEVGFSPMQPCKYSKVNCIISQSLSFRAWLFSGSTSSTMVIKFGLHLFWKSFTASTRGWACAIGSFPIPSEQNISVVGKRLLL